ncbi:MAG: hypothetical protein ACJAS4_002387 [Bacteriovoracaceae bacterium]|jgi:hypothetical protein
MSRLSVNPTLLYGAKTNLPRPESSKDLDKSSDLKTNSLDKPSEVKLEKNIETQKEASTVNLSERSKELKQKLSGAEKALKIHQKKFGNVEKPGIYFVSGFDWFGASSVKGNYDGISDMAEAIEGAEHYAWDEKDEIIKDIKKRKLDQPIVLVGHSFGGDGIVEIAQELNTIENGFRKIDLLVTLDSVGMDNDFIPQNVKKNINYIAQGPYKFLNDGPNIALNYKRTEVENYLRHEEHADLDDATDVQITILEEIEKLLS